MGCAVVARSIERPIRPGSSRVRALSVLAPRGDDDRAMTESDLDYELTPSRLDALTGNVALTVEIYARSVLTTRPFRTLRAQRRTPTHSAHAVTAVSRGRTS